MYNDLAVIFHENLLAAYSNYIAYREGDVSGRYRQLRGAVELATALFHFREHLPAAHTMSRAAVEQACSDYKLVGDVVNAAKHGRLTKGTPLVRAADDIKEITVVTRYADDQGEYSDSRTIMVVNCSDGSTRNLDPALITALNYWGQKLDALGVIKYQARSVPELPGYKFVSRADAKDAHLEILQGLKWQKGWKLQRYNPVTGAPDPIDLTGANITFRIYRPKYTLDIYYQLPGEPEPKTIPLDLSEEESIDYHGLRTEEEKESFTQQLADKRRAEIEKMIREAVRRERPSGPPCGG